MLQEYRIILVTSSNELFFENDIIHRYAYLLNNIVEDNLLLIGYYKLHAIIIIMMFNEVFKDKRLLLRGFLSQVVILFLICICYL